MANSGDPSTFTFTIDAFPAYTKFNKRKKVMAALQIIDPSVAGHNYADKSVIGHKNREHGVDIYGEGSDKATDIDKIYNYSIFDADNGDRENETITDDSNQGETPSSDDSQQGGTTTDTYNPAEEFVSGTTYYVADGNDGYVEADPQPTADNFGEGTYFIKG